MPRIRNVRKALSALIAMVLLLGSFSSFAYADNNPFGLSSRDFREAESKIMPEVMEDMKKEDVVEVLVYLKDQVNAKRVAEATRKALLSSLTPYNVKLAVRRGVVDALKDKAEASQANLLSYLRQEQQKSNVMEFKPYYIVNMVYVKAKKDVIENISLRPEVEKIYKNKVHKLDKLEINSEVVPAARGLEWNIEKIRADKVWELGFDGTGVVVANIDSGVQWTHVALQNKWRGYNPETGEVNPEGNWFDPVYGTELPEDLDNHGTHVMGIMVGQEADGSNKIGVAPGAKWIAARVFDINGNTTDRLLLDAAEWMLAPGGNSDNAPDVVNNSWGGLDVIDDWFREAVNNWRAAGIFPVFSAGNQRPGEPLPWPGSISNPANYPESFAVAATDASNMRAYFSKLGPSPYDESLIKPEISAPGVNVRSSIATFIPGEIPDGYGSMSGTSMAAPHVSGTVALLLSSNMSLTVDEIEDILTSTAVPLTDYEYPQSPNFGYGYGLVDAYSAVLSGATDIGYIDGRVLQDKEDTGKAVIVHEQEYFKAYKGLENIDIIAQVSDDVSVTEVELLVKQDGKSYWLLIPMERISGDYKNGTYKATITNDMLIGNSIIYKIRAKDYTGVEAATKDYKIDLLFGIVPDEYETGFEEKPIGWLFGGSWEWGEPTIAVEPFEGKKVVGTHLRGGYPDFANDWLITPPIDLRDSTLPSATLRFYEWYETEGDRDFIYLLISDDFGETWREARAPLSGDGMEWKEYVLDLRDYIGSQNPIFVAFRLTSVIMYIPRHGWYIDNVRLVGASDVEPPAIPNGFEAVAGPTGIKLRWEPSADADVSHYNVYRSLESEGEYELIGTTANNAFIDTEVEFGTNYYYKVSAVDLSGNESNLSDAVSATPLNTNILFGTDFEKDNGGFITGAEEEKENCWEWGIPTSGPNSAFSGEKLWATNLSGVYTANNDAYIESPNIEIPESDNNVVLAFNHWYELEEAWGEKYDYGRILISTDNGNSWINITPVEDGKYSGRIKKWEVEELSLNNFKGETVKLRFSFISDYGGEFLGWYVDDVYVVEVPHEYEVDEVELKEESILKEPVNPHDSKKMTYQEPSETSSMFRNIVTEEYETLEDEVVQNIPMARQPGIPVENAVVTILETGRSVKVDPVTGKFNIIVPAGEYTVRAEAYGYYHQDAVLTVEHDEITSFDFILESKPQGSIAGRVYDRYYQNPIPYAVIRLLEDRNIKPVMADENGYFTMEGVYEGKYTLRAYASGFVTGEFEIEVAGNETTNINIGLKGFVGGEEEEISYDNGIPVYGYVLSEANNGVAVRFTPSGYVFVTGAYIYFWYEGFPYPGGNEIKVVIFDTDQNGNPSGMVGEPKLVSINRGDWNYIDLSEFQFGTDRDFFIATVQTDVMQYSPGIAIDSTTTSDRSYIHYSGEEFVPITEINMGGAIMIRARVQNAAEPTGEPMENLPVNAVIVGDEAYDINYLNTNSDAQMKLINYFNEGNEIYVKLGDDLIVNLEGEIVGMEVLPDELTYYDANGRTTKYVK